ncbi:MAG: hypothetical protein WC788_00705 [Candidatus Paceibacterota bacterium]
MKQMLIEKTKKGISTNKTGLSECEESPACPACGHRLQSQENHTFSKKVMWFCDNDNCGENSFMRIKMGNKFFLIKP